MLGGLLRYARLCRPCSLKIGKAQAEGKTQMEACSSCRKKPRMTLSVKLVLAALFVLGLCCQQVARGSAATLAEIDEHGVIVRFPNEIIFQAGVRVPVGIKQVVL